MISELLGIWNCISGDLFYPKENTLEVFLAKSHMITLILTNKNENNNERLKYSWQIMFLKVFIKYQFYNIHCIKYRNFTSFPGAEIL